MILFDDMQIVSNELATQSKNCKLISHFNAKRAERYGLTTTSHEDPSKLWHQLHVLFPGLVNSNWKFRTRYCNHKKEKYGWKFWGVASEFEGEYYELLAGRFVYDQWGEMDWEEEMENVVLSRIEPNWRVQ